MSEVTWEEAELGSESTQAVGFVSHTDSQPTRPPSSVPVPLRKGGMYAELSKNAVSGNGDITKDPSICPGLISLHNSHKL